MMPCFAPVGIAVTGSTLTLNGFSAAQGLRNLVRGIVAPFSSGTATTPAVAASREPAVAGNVTPPGVVMPDNADLQRMPDLMRYLALIVDDESQEQAFIRAVEENLPDHGKKLVAMRRRAEAAARKVMSDMIEFSRKAVPQAAVSPRESFRDVNRKYQEAVKFLEYLWHTRILGEAVPAALVPARWSEEGRNRSDEQLVDVVHHLLGQKADIREALGVGDEEILLYKRRIASGKFRHYLKREFSAWKLRQMFDSCDSDSITLAITQEYKGVNAIRSLIVFPTGNRNLEVAGQLTRSRTIFEALKRDCTIIEIIREGDDFRIGSLYGDDKLHYHSRIAENDYILPCILQNIHAINCYYIPRDLSSRRLHELMDEAKTDELWMFGIHSFSNSNSDAIHDLIVHAGELSADEWYQNFAIRIIRVDDEIFIDGERSYSDNSSGTLVWRQIAGYFDVPTILPETGARFFPESKN